MKFEKVQFSKRYPAIECAIIAFHERGIPDSFAAGKLDSSIDTRRGSAVAILLPDGTVFTDVALCAAGDQFVKSIGKAKALRRAARSLLRPLVTPSSVDLNQPKPTDRIVDMLKNAIALQRFNDVRSQIGRQG